MSASRAPATDFLNRESPALSRSLPVPGTTGSPHASTAGSSDPLSHISLAGGTARTALDAALSRWPELAALRRAASAPRFDRFTTEVSSVVGSAHIALAAALLVVSQPQSDSAALTLSTARFYYHTLRSICLAHLQALSRAWFLRVPHRDLLRTSLEGLVGPSAGSQPADQKPQRGSVVGFRLPQYLNPVISSQLTGGEHLVFPCRHVYGTFATFATFSELSPLLRNFRHC